MRKILRPAAVALLILGAGVIAVLASGTTDQGGGKLAPPLPPHALIGESPTIADLRGKPAAVNFWASWCGPCKDEVPELERLYRSLHGEARLVSVDYTDDPDSARKFIRKYGLTYPVLSDPDGIYADRYGLHGVPTTAILDSQGRLLELLTGPQTEASLRSALMVAR